MIGLPSYSVTMATKPLGWNGRNVKSLPSSKKKMMKKIKLTHSLIDSWSKFFLE